MQPAAATTDSRLSTLPSYNSLAAAKMLSESLVAFLSELIYRPNAKRQVRLLPLGGIYWEDEMPDLREIMKIPEADRHQMFRLFGIRARLWKGEALPADEQLFWDTAHSQMPSWALFRRQTISDDDRQAQDEAERATTDGLGELFARADKVSISEKDGLQRFSATLNLSKEQRAVTRKASWWDRIFHRKRLPEI